MSVVDYETGLRAVEERRALVPQGATMAQFALRWILMFPEVTSTIPGAKNPQQAKDNVQAVSLPPLSDETMRRVREIYDKYLRAQVHPRWQGRTSKGQFRPIVLNRFHSSAL